MSGAVSRAQLRTWPEMRPTHASRSWLFSASKIHVYVFVIESDRERERCHQKDSKRKRGRETETKRQRVRVIVNQTQEGYVCKTICVSVRPFALA